MTTAPVLTEKQEHRQLVAHLRVLALPFTHIANEVGIGGRRGGGYLRVQNKKNGVSPGFPDFLIIVNKQLIAIELKRKKGSRVSPEQQAWIVLLNDAGVPARICKGYQEAVEFINKFRKPVIDIEIADAPKEVLDDFPF